MSRDSEDDPDDIPRRPRRRDDIDEFDDRPRRRRRLDRSGRGDAPAPSGNGLATAGLVLGILSFCTPCLAGVPAIICSLLALGPPGSPGRGRAVAGLILGAVTTLLTLSGVAVVMLLLPDRQTAWQALETNNLKELSLGAIRHHEAAGQFPTAHGPVSWRVHILPFIEQAPLHAQFDLTQPWDSPRNRSLADTRVKTFVSPLDPWETRDTRYRAFTGPITMFPPAGPRRIADVVDGTSNTILAVDAAEGVPWSAPRELPFTPNGPLPELGHPNRDIVIVAMADGAVRQLRKDRISPDVLKAAITAYGGETLPKDW